MKQAIHKKHYSGKELKDPNFILSVLKEGSSILEHVSQKILTDRAFILAAVGKNELALQYASEKLKNDLNFIRLVITRYPVAFQYLPHTKKLLRLLIIKRPQYPPIKPIFG